MAVGPEYRLTNLERGYLVALQNQPGFQVLMNIFESCVEEAKVDMINADPTKHEEVLVAHQMALAAAKWWRRAATRVNAEAQKFSEDNQDNKKPLPDVTEEIFN